MGAFFRHQKGLLPLFICGFGGCIFVSGYIFRLAVQTTDVNWTKTKDLDEINNKYEKKQFKFMNPGGYDYSQISNNRPDYKADELIRCKFTVKYSNIIIGTHLYIIF